MMLRRITILIVSGALFTGCYSHLRNMKAAHQRGYSGDKTTASINISADGLTNNLRSDHASFPPSAFYYQNYDVAEWYIRHGFEVSFPAYSGITDPSVSSYPLFFTQYSGHFTSKPMNFGPWVCWDPPYALPGYYPPPATVYIGWGYGSLHHPGISKGQSGTRTYGRRGFGTNRVKVDQFNRHSYSTSNKIISSVSSSSLPGTDHQIVN